MTRKKLSAGQQAMLEHKIHVQPDAYARSDGSVQEQLDTGWQGALLLANLLAKLPEPALRWWARQPAGHILFTANDTKYVAGRLDATGRDLAGVSVLPLALVVRQPRAALVRALLPLDHLLGCQGAENGPWLSDGGGVSPRWLSIGVQIARLFPLGYGLSPAAQKDPHLYLAEGLAAALTDRRRLNTADPKLERILKTSILSANFWERFLQEEDRGWKTGFHTQAP